MPKQLLKLTGERSTFQETLIRVRGFPDVAPPLVIANEISSLPARTAGDGGRSAACWAC
jgi:mannose-1-phosphate guanylyltransferase